MKIRYYKPTRSVYWFSGDTLLFAPAAAGSDGLSFDLDEGSAVDRFLVGDELISGDGQTPLYFRTLNDLYDSLENDHKNGRL